MYAVGEYVVHPGQGVCRVEEITAEPAASYQLLPITQRHSMRISFPVSSEDRLRPVLTHDEAARIIDSYPDIVKTLRSRIADVRAHNKKPPVAYERVLKHASERSLSELAVALGTSVEDVKALLMSRAGEDLADN